MWECVMKYFTICVSHHEFHVSRWTDKMYCSLNYRSIRVSQWWNFLVRFCVAFLLSLLCQTTSYFDFNSFCVHSTEESGKYKRTVSIVQNCVSKVPVKYWSRWTLSFTSFVASQYYFLFLLIQRFYWNS